MTAQEKLLKDIVHELNMGANDPIYRLLGAYDRKFVKSARMLARRVDELGGCPQDTVMYSLVARIWNNILHRFYNNTWPMLRCLFHNLDGTYREVFEEELLEKLNEMTDIELKWISQYSRNDRQLADLADEVLDRRSGV